MAKNLGFVKSFWWLVPTVLLGVVVYGTWKIIQRDEKHLEPVLCAMRLQRCVTSCEQGGREKTDLEEQRLHLAGCEQNCVEKANPECQSKAALCAMRIQRCLGSCKQEGQEKTDAEERRLHLAGCKQNCAEKTKTEAACRP